MRGLPYPDPGCPDTRSPVRYLSWLARGQISTIVVGTIFGTSWMLAQALVPWAIGHGIDNMVNGDTEDAWQWAAVLAALGIAQALTGVVRHRASVANWLYSAFRTIQVVSRHNARTGPAVPSTLPTGEVVATVAADAMHIGHAFEVFPRFAGAIVSYLAVSMIVLNTSVVLGLLVLVGVPLLVLALVPIVGPMQRRQRAQREALGELTSLGADTVVGLRVLRGIGGEQVFAKRYAERSETVRAAGVRTAAIFSILDAALTLLPGVFLALLTWIGARLVLDGQIAPGALVALYGYAFFLVLPVRTAGEMSLAATRAVVAARRVLKVLRIERDVPTSPVIMKPEDVDRSRRLHDHGEFAEDAVLADDVSGLTILPGELTMLTSRRPDETAAIANRMGRLVSTDGVRLGHVPLEEMPLSEVRRRILVSDPEPMLFTGTLRTALDPNGRHADTELLAAMDTVAADDILESMPERLDGIVDERARSLSGGQRQRAALARALLRDPEILILVEPTSAVDAHTEATIARRLRATRAGRTTVVVTASPLMLAQADTVVWFVDGQVAATGRHDDLLANHPGYRDTVIREEITT